jgi:hypothetical protein
MDRDCDTCLFTVVPKAKFMLLLKSGRYEFRNRGILVGREKLPDGREDFIVLDKEWQMWERVEREVLEEVQRVSDDTPIVIEEPVAPPAPPAPNIPAEDLAAAIKSGIYPGTPLPNHPESPNCRPSRRSSGGGLIDFGPLF